MMKQRKVPLRKCTGCQEMKDKRELIRMGRIYLPQYGMSGKGAEVQRSGTLLQSTCAQGCI